MHDLVPTNISELFSLVSTIHSYNTRSSASKNLYPKLFRTNIQKNSFYCFGVLLWNYIPSSIRNLKKTAFKMQIKKFLLSNLEKSGYDVDVSKLFLS